MPTTLAKELRKRHAFDSPEQEAMLNVVRTAGRLQEPFDRLFREHGVSGPLYNLLRIARGVGAPGVPVGEIAAQMISPGPDVTRLVDRLEKLELAERVRGVEDRRVVLVRVTPKGRRLLARVDPKLDALHRRVLGGLKPAELRTINELMIKAREAALAADPCAAE